MEANEDLAFDALSDKVRRQILAVIGQHGELSVTEITRRVDSVSRATISNHLRVLRMSGIVRDRRHGRNRYFSLDQDGSVRDALSYLHAILKEGLETEDPVSRPAAGPHRDLAAG